jgi:hypothetical protein
MTKTFNNSIFESEVRGGYTKKQQLLHNLEASTRPENSLLILKESENCYVLNAFEEAPTSYINFLT